MDAESEESGGLRKFFAGEFDLIAEVFSKSEQSFLVGECKWWKSPVGINVLKKMKQKVRYLPEQIDGDLHFVLFSAAGFTPELIELAKIERIVLITGEELMTNL
ncbi:MAG: restriction endonuclease [Candidatus Electryonea clarkiae]|nr:restriction endonuclease [Candidatus Electryonea clarkiae]MDP8287769.1 restriction endonuclease [Candidatus Electryonea clarkiae]